MYEYVGLVTKAEPVRALRMRTHRAAWPGLDTSQMADSRPPRPARNCHNAEELIPH